MAAGGAVLVIDSTNGGRAGRAHVRALFAARLVLVVVLRPAGAVEGGHLGAAEDWLLGRATGRAAHPVFPPDDEPERQRQKVRIALPPAVRAPPSPECGSSRALRLHKISLPGEGRSVAVSAARGLPREHNRPRSFQHSGKTGPDVGGDGLLGAGPSSAQMVGAKARNCPEPGGGPVHACCTQC